MQATDHQTSATGVLNFHYHFIITICFISEDDFYSAVNILYDDNS